MAFMQDCLTLKGDVGFIGECSGTCAAGVSGLRFRGEQWFSLRNARGAGSEEVICPGLSPVWKNPKIKNARRASRKAFTVYFQAIGKFSVPGSCSSKRRKDKKSEEKQAECGRIIFGA